MDEKYLIMIKEASELQDLIEEKPDTLYCEGHHVYIKYPVHDEITGEDSYAIWSWGKRWLKEPLWKPEEIKIPRQEDLQEIYMESTNLGVLGTMARFGYYEQYLNGTSYQYVFGLEITIAWLCFVMDRLYNKRWNSKTESWEDKEEESPKAKTGGCLYGKGVLWELRK